MIIQSYLVYPEPGRAEWVAKTLESTSGCAVIPAENRELLVLVTEADDEAGQKELETKLESLDGITCLAMVGGWSE